LLDVLESHAKKISIVSPWVLAARLEETGILDAMAEARSRGVEVEVYLDPKLSKGNLEEAEASLSRAGAATCKVVGLHSKIVLKDSEVLAVGSFNWLSAQRSGSYVRHETSMVYRGAHLSEEIEKVLASLRQRVVNR